MNVMNDVLAKYLDDFVVVFSDDILVSYRNIRDHAKHLAMVLDKLQHHHLFAKASKCHIATTSIKFRG